MKKSLFTSLLGMTVLSFVFFSACEIGLGSSVDVEAPKIEFADSTVESGAVVRDAFAVCGKWTDDGSIGSITATLKNLSSGASFKKNGSIKDGNWTVTFSPAEEAIPDGSYELSVAIKDTADHETKVSRAFTIDNTPPLVVLSRPSTKLGATLAGTASFDSYGQKFTLEGKAADDNDVSLIEVNVYDNPDCSGSPLKTISLPNVPLTIETDVAEYSSTVPNDYAVIYGHVDTSGIAQLTGDDAIRYCKLVVYDGAQRYPADGSAQSDADKKGNSVDYYYLNSDISSLFTEGYKITELYHILNGTYTGGARTTSPADVISRLNSASTKVNIGQFKLNPMNNPKFVVSARNPLQAGDNFSNNSYDMTNGNNYLEIEVSPGLDGHLIRQETVGVYLVRCDNTGTNLLKANGEVADDEDDAKTIWLINPGAQNYDTYQSNVPLENQAKITQSGSSYKFKTLRQIGTEYYTNIATGENYLIRVVGRDSAPGNGNPIMSDGPYGFKLITSGLNIEVRTSKSTEWISTNENANAENRNPVVTLDYAIANKPFSIYRSFEAEGSGIESSSPIISGLQTTPYADTLNSTNLTIDSSGDTKTATVYYLVKGKDSSESNLKDETFKLDNNAPQVAITEYPNPTPTGQTSITLRGTATDYAPNSANTGLTSTELSGVKKVYIQIIDGTNDSKATKAYDDSTITPTELQKITASLSDGTWMCQINPSDYSGTGGAFEDKGTKTIKVTAIDGVGLKTTTTTTFDYDTANPVVTITGSQLSAESQVTTIPSSVGKPIKLRGTVSDDYKIKRIRLRQTKDGGSPVEKTIEDFSTPITAASTTPHLWETPDLPLTSNGNSYSLDELRDNLSDTDGTYTYEIIVEDAAGLTATPAATTGKTSSTSKTIILKTPLPTITFDSPFNYTNETASTWQTSTSVSISGTATPNGSSNELSISKVYWKLISATSYNSATAPAVPVLPTENVLDSSSWSGWNTATGTTSWFINLTSDSGLTNSILTPTASGVTGPLHNRIYIACVDTAGNISTSYDRIIKVDSSVPTLTANYYQIGSGAITAVPSTGVSSLYIQSGSSLTLYGNYSDEQSGVTALSFQLGEGDISPTTSYSTTPVTLSNADTITYSNTVNSTTKSWKAEFTPEANGNLSVKGVNGASRDKTITVFNLTIDNDEPSLLNIVLKETTGTGTSATTKDAYLKPADSKYYINNTASSGKSYKITGVVSDLGGIDTLSIAVTNTGNTSNTLSIPSIQNANGTFEFVLMDSQRTDMQSWSNGATAVITARDKSGRSVSQTVNIVFDSIPPKAMHWADAKNKDIYFRIGDADNDKNASEWETGDTVGGSNDSVNQDVGSKYSYGSWGNNSRIEIRGYFNEASTGSGLKAIHYAIFDAPPSATQISAFESGTLTTTGSVKFIGSFDPLETPETKKVPYNQNRNQTNNKATKDGVITNFKTQLSGFNLETNYLILVAEDNAGNRAADTLKVTEGTNTDGTNNGTAILNGTNNWNSDNDTATAYYTIHKDTDAPTITSAVTGNIYTNGDASAEAIEVSGTVNDGTGAGIASVTLTISGLSNFNQTADISGSNWSYSIPASTFATTANGASYQVKATAKDKAGAGNITEIPVRTILVDKAGPSITISSPAQTAKVGATNFVISGNANDGNGAGLSTAAGSMKLYYTTASNLGSVTEAPASDTITIGTNPANSWVELTDGSITVNSDNTWQSNSASPYSLTAISTANENTNLYFIISAKDSSGTGNTGYSVPRKITVDRKTPTFVSGTAGGSSNAETWLNTRTVNISGSFADPATGSGSSAIAGSGVSTIKYQVGSAAPQSLPTADGSYDKTISLANSVTQETITVWAVDAAGNEIPATDTTNRKSYTIKIDTTAPLLTANYYRRGSDTSVPLAAPSGTIYMKSQSGGTSFTLYGNYTDPTGGSGIKQLKIKKDGLEIPAANLTSLLYSEEEITGTNGTVPADSTYGTYSAASATSYKSWKAVFTVTTGGRITVEGEDLAGNTVSASALDITIDDTPPEVSNVKLNVTTGTGSSAVTNEVYSATTTSAGTTTKTYYLNNTVSGKTFTVTGLATDNVGLQSAVLNIVNTATSPATALTSTAANPNGSLSFTVVGWSGWTTGANATITLTDKAGNTVTSEPLNISFDTVAPLVDSTKLKTPSTIQTESSLFKFEGEEHCVHPTETDTVFSGYDKVDILFTTSASTPDANAAAQATANVATNGSWSSTVEFANSDFNNVFVSSSGAKLEGTKYLWVRAYDNAGNVGGWVSKDFVYDTATPTISFTPTASNKNPAADSYRNNGFKLEVNVSDSYGVQSVQVIYGLQNATTTSTTTATINSEGKYEKTFIVGTEQAQNTEAIHLENGDYTLTVRVTDNSGKTNTVSRSFSIDTAAPVIDMTATATRVTRTADYSTWHKTNQIPVIVSVSDSGAGIGAVQVSTDGTNFANPTNLMQSDSGWTGTIVCGAQGTNTIYIKATDAVGNATTVSSENALTVNIDTTPPADPIFLGISTGTGNSLTATPASQITSVLVNKDVPVTVYAALIDDSTAGASTFTGIPAASSAAALKQKGKTGTSAYIASSSDLPAAIWNAHPDDVTDDYTFWSYEIATTDMRSGGVNFTVKDNAGNEADYVLFQMTVDNTAPTATLNQIANLNLERASNDTTTYVNGTITLSGTASDNQKLESVKVEYKKHSDADTAANWTEIPAPANASLASWTRTLDTTTLDDETEYDIRVSATDSAGNPTDNSATSTTVDARTQTVKVSQDTDRPIIKFTNLSLPATMSATGRLSFRNEELYGNITDDDGVPLSLSYYYGTGTPTADSDWKTTPNLSYSSGSFTLKFKDANDRNDDGPHHLYFKVTDASGTSGKVFTSQDVITNAAALPDTPKVIDNSTSNKYGYITRSGTGTDTDPVTYSSSTTVTYLTVDTTDPYRGNLKFSTNYSATTPTWQEKTDISAIPFGGNRNSFKIKIPAWDVNGVTISMTIEDYTGAITFAETTESAGDAIYTDAKYWVSSEISIPTTMETGVKACNIDVFDGVRHNKDDFSISVDNTAPEISATAPSSTQYSSGNVIAYGETDLTYWKNTSTTDTPREYMYYALSLDDETEPAENQTAAAAATANTITSWKDEDGTSSALVNDEEGNPKTYKPYYTPILGGSFNWYVYFDGSSSTASETHDATFRGFLVNSGVTTQALLDTTDQSLKFRTKVKAYLWIKAVDQVGNETVIKHPILIDPQGDAPSVSIDYPETSGTTLGGTITLRGSANDSKGANPGVESVWVQIISSINNGYDSSATASHTTGTRTAGGLVFGDTVTPSGSGENITYSHAYTLTSFVPKIKDVKQWLSNGYHVYKDITTIDNASTTTVTEGPDEVTSIDTSIADSADGSAYYIKANFSGSAWNLKINEHSEFNPESGKLNPIAYRVFAKDNDGNLSSYEQQLSVYDSDNPVISNVYLRQYSNNTAGTGTVTASRAYEDDMWVRGTWWLCGTVKDTQGLSKLEVGPSGAKVNQNPAGTANTDQTFKYKLNSGSGVGKLTIIIEADDIANVGQNPHTTTKECVINYDNTPPELLGSTVANFNISSTVQNSNGFYTFGSQVMENPVNNAAQSGFDYLAFWFERDLTTETNPNAKHVVYDVMRPKTQTSGDTVVNTSEVEWADLATTLSEIEARGLKWKTKTVTRSQSQLGHLTMAGTDANIHVGGLCMLKGSVYMITSVETTGTGSSATTTIGINGQPEYEASQTAYFAIANVVNNTVEAGSGAKSTADGMYGYYSSMSNDDGDHMIESVSKQGTIWTWEANINSQNIADGSIVLHYIAFDKAGNFITGQVDGNVANNAPRIASLKVWSDFNENGTEETGESETRWVNGKERKLQNESGSSYYATRSTGTAAELVVSGNNKDYTDGGSAFMTVKATTRFIPELVGGNGDLYYTYKYGTASTLASETNTPRIGTTSIGKGSDDGIDEDVDSSGYYVQDQNQAGYINGRTDLYPAGTAANAKHYMEIPGAGAEGTYSLNGIGNSTAESGPTWFEYTIYDSTEGSSSTWNSTTHDTTGRLSAKFRVALNLKYQDTTSPIVKIRPFYWNSKTDNSVSWDSAGNAQGHIELEGDLTSDITGNAANQLGMGNDPKVSGKIKIEGYAFDDIKLKQLYVQFANHSNLNTAKLASTYNGSWSTRTYANGWGFTAEDVYCNANGHLVHWILTVDTAERTNKAELDKAVVVYAIDDRASLESEHDDENPDQTRLLTYVWGNVKEQENALTTYYTDFYCNTKVTASTPDSTVVYKESDKDSMTYYYKMDIVPYITEVTTNLSNYNRNKPSVYARTAIGNYSVSSGEQITIRGFNLKNSQNTVVTINGVNNSFTSSSQSATAITGTVANAATSGKLELYAYDGTNRIYALNNKNGNDSKGSATALGSDNSNGYNRQPNGINNNLLTDDVVLDVYEFTTVATPRNGVITDPFMRINPKTGQPGFSFNNAVLYFNMPGYDGDNGNTTYSHTTFGGDNGGYTNGTFAWDANGNSFGIATCTDTGWPAASISVTLFSKRTPSASGYWHPQQAYTNAKYQRGIESNTISLTADQPNNAGAYTTDIGRIISPAIATKVSGTGNNATTTLYIAYYDRLSKQVRFRTGTVANDANTITGALQDIFYRTDSSAVRRGAPDSIYVDGASKQANDENSQTINQTNATGTSNGRIEIVASKSLGTGYLAAYQNDTTYGPGEHVDIGLSGNNVVITWYDSVNRKLMVSYENPSSLQHDTLTATGTLAYSGDWQSNAFAVEDTTGVGLYVKMAVDPAGGIHLAYYNNNGGDLKYAYISSSDLISKQVTSTQIVDSYLSVGARPTIDVTRIADSSVTGGYRYVPYIGYQMNSNLNTTASARLAYPVRFNTNGIPLGSGSDDNDMFTGNWEIKTVPTQNTPIDGKISAGVWTSNGVQAAIPAYDTKGQTAKAEFSEQTVANRVNKGASYAQTPCERAIVWGNGTMYPVISYAVSEEGKLEMAQQR